MGQRQAEDQGPEQLGLPGAGRADDQAMRSHAALRGFLDVQLDGLAAGVQADRYPEPAPGRARAPQPGQVQRLGAGHAQQCSQGGVHGERVIAGRAAPRRAQRRQLAGQRLRLGQRQRVRRADPRQDIGACPVPGHHPELPGRDLQPQRGRVGGTGVVARHVDQGHAVHPVAAELVVWPYRRAVHDHHVVRERAALAGGEARPVLQVRAEHALELLHAARHQPDRARGVALGRVPGVRQPLDPVPFPHPVRRGAHADPHVLRGVEHGQLGEDRAHHAAGRVRIAAGGDPAERAQRHADRQLGHPAVGPDEPAERARTQRIEILGRLGLRRHQPDRELLGAGAEPEAAEIGVLRPAFPHPGPLVGRHHPPQRGRLRAGPLQRVPLGAGRPPHVAPDLAEVAQVVTALAVQPELAVALAPGQLAERHPAHAQAHRAAADPAQRAGPRPGHHRHHAERHGQHGHVGHHLLHAVGRRFGDLRRRLEHDLAVGHLRRLAPLLTPHDDGAHRSPFLPRPARTGPGPGAAACVRDAARAGRRSRRVLILRADPRIWSAYCPKGLPCPARDRGGRRGRAQRRTGREGTG